jgi:hypothetical protein
MRHLPEVYGAGCAGGPFSPCPRKGDGAPGGARGLRVLGDDIPRHGRSFPIVHNALILLDVRKKGDQVRS